MSTVKESVKRIQKMARLSYPYSLLNIFSLYYYMIVKSVQLKHSDHQLSFLLQGCIVMNPIQIRLAVRLLIIKVVEQIGR